MSALARSETYLFRLRTEVCLHRPHRIRENHCDWLVTLEHQHLRGSLHLADVRPGETLVVADAFELWRDEGCAEMQFQQVVDLVVGRILEPVFAVEPDRPVANRLVQRVQMVRGGHLPQLRVGHRPLSGFENCCHRGAV